MGVFVIILVFGFTAVSGVIWYRLYATQKLLEAKYAAHQQNNFYLQVKKTEEQKLPTADLEKEPGRTIVDISEDEPDVRVAMSNSNGVMWSTKQIDIVNREDTREKIVVQINYKESLGQGAYHRVDRTFILRKGMDVEEVMGILGEPYEVDYPTDGVTVLRYEGAGDDDHVNVYIDINGLWKIEKYQ